MQGTFIKFEARKLWSHAVNFAFSKKLHINLPNFIRYTYGKEGIRLFWRYGNTLSKLEKVKHDVQFLRKCQIYGVTP